MGDLMVRGAIYGTSGTPVPETAGLSGAQRVQDAHGRFQDAARLRRLFFLDSDAVTLAAANTTKSAMGTAKLINGFYNPAGSGFRADILKVWLATVSGTPAGGFFWNFLKVTGTLTSARTGTVRPGMLSDGAGNSIVHPLVNVVLATTPADTTVLAQLGCLGGPAAVAAGAGVYQVVDEIASSIIVPPGYLLGLMATGAGTTHIVQSTIMWEEVPELP